ncbi:MAG TPA: hypothetical protein VFY05_05160, partial [Candidatus Angelobacter sp.]|nr:hypothetical protein [Candidatus Angelobacter sp.]
VAQWAQEDRLMMARQTSTLSPTMERARQRFERWRKTRSTSSPIPEGLWALAVRVASAHGLNPTAQALRLNYNALKQRVHAAGNSASPPQPPATFIELTPALSAGSSPCTIELENAQGAKMKIHLARPEALDMVALSRSLWSGER